MKDAKDIKIPDIGKKYGKGLKNLFFVFWLLAAIAGTAIAVGLGLTRNDWLVIDSSISGRWQEIGRYLALGGAGLGASVLGLYGLLSIFRKRQWLLFVPCLALGTAFPALLYAPHWAPFALGGGAIVLGMVALKLSDRKAARAAKTS